MALFLSDLRTGCPGETTLFFRSSRGWLRSLIHDIRGYIRRPTNDQSHVDPHIPNLSYGDWETVDVGSRRRNQGPAYRS